MEFEKDTFETACEAECELSDEEVDFGSETCSEPDEPEFIVDEFFWPVVNAICTNTVTPAIRESNEWNLFNQALQTTNATFVYRLGNLGMTYDLEKISGSDEEIENEVIKSDSLTQLTRRLYQIYCMHGEEQAIGLLDMFTQKMGVTFFGFAPCPLDAFV